MIKTDYTVNVVLINEKGQICCVSRKDEHDKFGLIGGKVDPEDFHNTKNNYEALVYAACRESFEETGLHIYDLELVFASGKYDNMGYTFIAKYKGKFNYNEPHVVKWGTSKDLLDGPFSKYNKEVLDSLKNLNINYL